MLFRFNMAAISKRGNPYSKVSAPVVVVLKCNFCDVITSCYSKLCNFMWFNCDILMCNFCDEVYSCFYKVIQCDLHVLLSPWFVCAILVMTSYYLYEIWCDVHMCFCHNKIKFSLKFSHIYNMLKRWQHHEKNVRLSREK